MLFGKIWVEEDIPEDCRHGHLFKPPPKGNLKDGKTGGHYATVNTRESIKKKNSGKNENRG